MPPVLGPWSPSKTRLWSCAAASGIAVSPSHSAKNEASSPLRNSSITTSAPASPSAAAEHHVDRGFRLRDRLRDDDALAGREPVGLDDDRRALRAHVGLRGRGRGETLIGRGRNVVRPAQVLGEALGAFEPRRGLARAECLDAGGGEIVDDARHTSGASGPTTTRSIVPRAAECDHRRMVGDVERDAVRLRARCRHCPARNRACRPADSPQSSRRARARARRNRAGGCSSASHFNCQDVRRGWCSMACLARKARTMAHNKQRTTFRGNGLFVAARPELSRPSRPLHSVLGPPQNRAA